MFEPFAVGDGEELTTYRKLGRKYTQMSGIESMFLVKPAQPLSVAVGL